MLISFAALSPVARYFSAPFTARASASFSGLGRAALPLFVATATGLGRAALPLIVATATGLGLAALPMQAAYAAGPSPDISAHIVEHSPQPSIVDNSPEPSPPKATLDYVDAVFSVTYNGKDTAGENHLLIKREGDVYTIDFDLDHWMLSSQQNAQFHMQACQVQPQSFTATHKRPFKSKETQSLKFDWGAQTAHFTDPKRDKNFDLDGEHTVYDPLSFFFEARCALMDGARNFTYPVIRKGRQGDQEFAVVDTQIVSTPMGDFEALVVERVRSNPKRQTRLYVAPALDYLLVKIEHQESALLNIVATLKDIDYSLSTE